MDTTAAQLVSTQESTEVAVCCPPMSYEHMPRSSVLQRRQSHPAQSSMEYLASLFFSPVWIWSMEYQWTTCTVYWKVWHGYCWTDGQAQQVTDNLTTLEGNWRKLDSLLLQQCPPHYYTRTPWSLAKHLAYWKASEIRTGLLYYALPVLSEFLPPLYLHHTSLLVTAVHILPKQDISEPQISAAEAMIDTFYKLLPELYGEESCTANAHCLTHITKYVRLWGPLWTHSVFGFESMNGHLKKLFHSHNQVHDQLLFSVQVSQTLQRLHTQLAENEDERTLQFLSFCSNTLPQKTV